MEAGRRFGANQAVRRLSVRIIAALLLVVPVMVVLCSVAVAQVRSASLRPADLLAHRRILEISPSPDGRVLAIVVARPSAPGELSAPDVGDFARADVWLVNQSEGRPLNITRGRPSRTGCWLPRWSPDGRFLAIVCVRSDSARIEIVNRTGKRVRKIGDRSIDLGLTIFYERQSIDPQAYPSPVGWLDNKRLLTIFLARGEIPLLLDESQSTEYLEHKLTSVARSGSDVTAIAMQSPGDERPSEIGKIEAVDVADGTERLLGTVPIARERLARRTIVISPSKSAAALIFSTRSVELDGRVPDLGDIYAASLGIVRLRSPPRSQAVLGLSVPVVTQAAIAGPVAWRPDGNQLAVPAAAPGAICAHKVVLVDAKGDGIGTSTATLPSLTGPSDCVRDIGWSGNGRLILVSSEESASFYSPLERERLWSIDLAQEKTEWAFREVKSSGALMLFDGGGIFELAHGKLSERVDVDHAPAGAPPIEVPGQINASGRLLKIARNQTIIVDSQSQNGELIFGLRAKVGGFTLTKPSALPVGVSLQSIDGHNWGVVGRDLQERIFSGKFSGDVMRVLATFNPKSQVHVPTEQTTYYNTPDGATAAISVLLPENTGGRCKPPAIFDVYGGIEDPAWRSSESPYSRSLENPLLLVSRGYAVVRPALPLPSGPEGDRMAMIGREIDAAAAEVARQDLVDPERMALLGQSYGGYSVYAGLINSRRFRAGISVAGFSDMISFYGSFDYRYRYSSSGAAIIGPFGLESQQFALGVPYWSDPERYVRNSPVFGVEHINAPLLMLHGSEDVAPVGQDEEMFTALRRLGRTVSLVRYIGEGHSISSPKNFVDAWSRIYGWLDEYVPTTCP